MEWMDALYFPSKKVLFSNVKLKQDVQQRTNTEKQVQHLNPIQNFCQIVGYKVVLGGFCI